MLKSSLKKIYLAIFCLVLAFIIYMFPKKDEDFIYLTPKTSYSVSSMKDVLYVPNKNDYVSRINIYLKGKTKEEKAMEAIKYLTDGESSKMLPIGFKPIIPKNTKVLGIKNVGDNLTVDFDSNLLKVKSSDSVRMIESIIYSLTSIKGINNISIKVDGKPLNNAPNTNIYLNEVLDRSYGINKEYNIDSIRGTTKTTIYYAGLNNGFKYYIPVTKISNDTSPKIEIIIKELTSSLAYSQDLMSYLSDDTNLKKYELASKTLSLDFNNAILKDITDSKILEEVTYAINLSVKDNYDIDSVLYNVDDKKVATFDLKDLE